MRLIKWLGSKQKLNTYNKLHLKQKEFFNDQSARFKIISKGRRFGFTRGLAMYAIRENG